MECLYTPDIEPHSTHIVVTGDEVPHARALRLRAGEKIMLTSGRGFCAEAVLDEVVKQHIVCTILRLLPNHGELPFRTTVALGILDNRERMEFALEKAIELGVSNFIPLITKHSERDRTKHERLLSKAIAAMKQSQRAQLPTVHKPRTPITLLSMLPTETQIVLADVQGLKPSPYSAQSVCLCVGPEGGFSDEEHTVFCNDARTVLWKLAPARLRAETAMISGLSAITLFHQ